MKINFEVLKKVENDMSATGISSTILRMMITKVINYEHMCYNNTTDVNNIKTSINTLIDLGILVPDIDTALKSDKKILVPDINGDMKVSVQQLNS